ncbi:pentatricopeptide repeat-containing protein At5g65570 [Aristolochia californica]|uniref:pentatricopeptide repeat-containing protein At5g65570 n=1 Tax=Aristolochia californica TaxID=171875 RepID=UPI0035D587D4
MQRIFCGKGIINNISANFFKIYKSFRGVISNSENQNSSFVGNRTFGAESDATNYISLLRECTLRRSMAEVKRVHFQMKTSGSDYLSLGNKLIDAYLKCGSIEEARKVFDEMPRRHIVTWNSLISAYIRSHGNEEALELYQKMLPEGVIPDEFTFSSVLKVFSNMGLPREGRKAHGRLISLGLDVRNIFVGSALVNMYSSFGDLQDARHVLDQIVEKDVVLFTSLIVGCTQNGEDSEALKVFVNMVSEGINANEFTVASILIASGNLAELCTGKVIHGMMIKFGFGSAVASQTSLLSMYSKCGLVDDSVKVFYQVVNPNLVTWTAVITGLVHNSRETHALKMFCRMIRDSVNPNAFTISTVLRACSSLTVLQEGNQIHAHTIKTGLDMYRFVVSALLDLYGKCGTIEMAKCIFDSLGEPDIVSINSMIYGYAQNGLGEKAIRLFDQISNWGLQPNEASFICVLSACSNCGLLEEGKRIFSFLCSKRVCGPTRDHYACMIDLLGRAGRLEEAECLITQIKQPDVVLWRALLSACKIHGDVEITKRAEKFVRENELGDEGTYVLISNIYASTGNWHEVDKMKALMREMKLKKAPGLSRVEVNREKHTFMAGEETYLR